MIKHDDVASVLYSQEAISAKVSEMGAQITADYKDAVERGEQLLLVGLLRGAAIFMADLVRAIKLPILMDYMAVSSYGNGTKSSGMVRICKDLSEDIANRHVIIVEDVIDTGLTLKYIRKNLASRNPLSIEIAAFLHKGVEGQANVNAKYVGFDCNDDFFVGYGLDYAERYRNLPCVCILKPEVYE